jgi:glycosyltransferase involved in cell wall biosynthesis
MRCLKLSKDIATSILVIYKIVMKKISIVLPHLSGGGAEKLHVHLANYWHSKGFQIDFVLAQKQGELLNLLPKTINVINLDVDRIRKLVWPLARYLKTTRPDILIVAMWPLTSITVLSWLLAGKLGRLYLSDHTQLSISSVYEIHTPAWLLGAIMHITYPFANGIIAVSKGVKQDMCMLGGLTDASVRVIYNPTALGLSPHRESELIGRQLWGNNYDHHILSAGTLKEQKDHVTLIRAFALLTESVNAKLIILGEGPLRSMLETLVVELGLHGKVSFPGFAVDPYPWFRSADLFVLSSRWEGFGNVIVEALECGVPVISTDCPSGPSEILENGRYGKLVPIQNPSALAEALKVSLNTKHDSAKLVRRAKDFSVERIAEEYLTYINPEGA